MQIHEKTTLNKTIHNIHIKAILVEMLAQILIYHTNKQRCINGICNRDFNNPKVVSDL
jgi:hypothetical protein